MLFIVLALWLAWPILFPVHVEGFSASIVALGMHFAHGSVAEFFASQPFDTEYFTLTKLGAVLGVAGLSDVFGLSGADAMRVVMWCGLALLLPGSALLVRRWSEAPWPVVCLSLLLMPGLLESGFFFNDNVPGAGLMIAALAIFDAHRSVVRWLVTGVLIGLAVAVRIDLILVCVAVPLIALDAQKTRAAAATAVVGATAVVTVFAIFAVIHATPFDALKVGAVAVGLWERPGSLFFQYALLIPFCSVAGLILLLLGAGAEARRRNWLRVSLLIGVPVLVNLALAGKIWEVRQFLALTPFFGALIAQGIGALLAEFRAGSRVVPITLGVMVAVTFLSPPTYLYLKDGPRSVMGRLAGIGLWRSWQKEVERDFSTIDAAIGAAPAGGTLAIMTDQWDEDRYLHLTLYRDGYRAAPATPSCQRIGSVLQKGDRRIVHLTLQQTFVAYWQDIQADRVRHLALPCLNGTNPTGTLLLIRADRATILFDKPTRRYPVRPVEDSRLSTIGYMPIIAVPMDAVRLTQLENGYRANRSESARKYTVPHGMEATAARTRLFR